MVQKLLASIGLLVLVGCVSHKAGVEARSRRAMQLAARMVHYLRESKGAYPGELGVWGELWGRGWLIDHSPHFAVVHDPHHLQVFDYWEHPIRYEVVSGSVVLTSGGPNGRVGDQDDIVEVVARPE